MAAEVNLNVVIDMAMGRIKERTRELETTLMTAMKRIQAGSKIDVFDQKTVDGISKVISGLERAHAAQEKINKAADYSIDLNRRIEAGEVRSIDKRIAALDRYGAALNRTQIAAEKQARAVSQLAGPMAFGQGLTGNLPASMRGLQAASRSIASSPYGFAGGRTGEEQMQRLLASSQQIGSSAFRAVSGGGRVGGVDPFLAASAASTLSGGISVRSGASLSTQMATAARNAAELGQNVSKAEGKLREFNNRGKFTVQVLEAFFLYRGFVFLQQGLINSTKAMIDLNHQVSLIMTQLPNFGEGMRGVVTDEILRVAKETGVAFTEVAQTLYQITSAGYSGAEAFKALELSTKAAVAGGTSADAAFNAALSQMNAFGDSAGDLSSILDKQFQLVKRGIFSYTQFTQVSAITAEAFANAGQSIETANAALATISQVFTGPQLNRGATALRNLALSIANTPEKWEALGVAVTDTNGDFRDLIPILSDLERKVHGLSESDVAATLHEILPEKREGQAIAALLGQMGALKRNYIEQKLALGSLDKAYQVVNKDIATQLGILKNNVQSSFGGLADGLGSVVSGLNDMEKMLPGITVSIISMTTAVMGLALATQYLGKVNAQTGLSRAAGFGQTMMNPMLGNPRSRLPGSGFRGLSASSPLAAAGYIGAASIGSGLGGADNRGMTPEGFFGSVAAGGAMGALGGAPGAAIGASLGAVTYLISQFEAESKESARRAAQSFYDAYVEESEKRGVGAVEAYENTITRGGEPSRGIAQILHTNVKVGSVSDPAMAAAMARAGRHTGPFQNTPFSTSAYAREALAAGFAEEKLGREKGRLRRMAGEDVDIEKMGITDFTTTIRDWLEPLGEEGKEVAYYLNALGNAVRQGGIEEKDAADKILLLNVSTDAFLESLNIGTDGISDSVGSAVLSVESFADSLSKVNARMDATSSVFSLLGDSGKDAVQGISNTKTALAAIQALSSITTTTMVPQAIGSPSGPPAGYKAPFGTMFPQPMGAPPPAGTPQATKMVALTTSVAQNLGLDEATLKAIAERKANEEAVALEKALREQLGVGATESLAGKEEAVVAAVEKMANAAQEAADRLEAMNKAIERNTHQIEGINLDAEMQNRGLTAEESDRISRLKYSSHIIEGAKQSGMAFAGGGPVPRTGMAYVHAGEYVLTPEDRKALFSLFGVEGLAPMRIAKMGVNPTLLREMNQGGTYARLVHQGLNLVGAEGGRFSYGQTDIDSLRMYDRIAPGVRPSGGRNSGAPGERNLYKVLAQLAQSSRESANRGGQNIYFNGPTVPSELDMSIQQLGRLGPAMVRQKSRGR
jgi:TP901 family phage tail tape measure protein